MQIVPLLAECGLSGTVDEELQCPAALSMDPCTSAATYQLSKVFPVLSITAVFLLLDQPESLVSDAGLAAAAAGEALPTQWHYSCCGAVLQFWRLPEGVSRAQDEA